MASPWESAYNQALYAARRDFERSRANVLRQLYQEFARMLVRIEEEAGAGTISAERAEGLRRSIQQALSRLALRFEGILGDGASSAAQLAADGHAAALASASRATGVAVSFSFTSVPVQALELMMVRRGLGLSTTFRTLVRRNVQGLAGDIDAFLTSAVARGVSNQRAARELATIMARNDPVLLRALESLGPRGGRTAKAIREGVQIDPGTARQVRSLLVDARRIAVSEINSAHDEADKLAARRSPVVDLLHWRTSGRHAGLPSSPDVCDIVAEADPHGYGPGLYHPETCPSLLHPYCQCTTSKVLRPPADWDKPKRPVPELRAIGERDVARILEAHTNEYSRSVTPKHIEAQLRAANQKLQAAHQVAGTGAAARV